MSPKSKPPVLPPLPAVLVSILSAQGGAALAKGLFPVLGPSGTVGLRIGMSAVILLAAFRPRLHRLNAAQWRVVLPFGVVLGVMNLVFYHSLSRIPLGLAVTVEFIGPLSVAVFGSRKLIDVVWVGLAGAGIALITPWTAGSGVDPLGVAFAFAAGICWALYIVIGKRLSHLLSGGAAVSIGMLVATVAVVPVAAAAGGFAHLTVGRFAAGVGVALLSSAVPYTLEMIALKALPARTFGILMSLEPAVAALVGLAFLDEVLSAAQWLAVALVIVASAGSTLSSRRIPEPREADAGEGWPNIQLLYFAGCPHAEAARALLRTCLGRLGLSWPVEEKNGDYPSPTILIDGIDVMGKPPTAYRMCRLDVPTEERLMTVLAKYRDLA